MVFQYSILCLCVSYLRLELDTNRIEVLCSEHENELVCAMQPENVLRTGAAVRHRSRGHRLAGVASLRLQRHHILFRHRRTPAPTLPVAELRGRVHADLRAVHVHVARAVRDRRVRQVRRARHEPPLRLRRTHVAERVQRADVAPRREWSLRTSSGGSRNVALLQRYPKQAVHVVPHANRRKSALVRQIREQKLVAANVCLRNINRRIVDSTLFKTKSI